MENETEIKTEKKMGAKNYSKFAMIFSTVWIIVMTVLKGLNIIALEIDDIIYSGIAVVAVWCPTFVSIYLDKIKEIKQARSE